MSQLRLALGEGSMFSAAAATAWNDAHGSVNVKIRKAFEERNLVDWLFMPVIMQTTETQQLTLHLAAWRSGVRCVSTGKKEHYAVQVWNLMSITGPLNAFTSLKSIPVILTLATLFRLCTILTHSAFPFATVKTCPPNSPAAATQAAFLPLPPFPLSEPARQ
eukprot:1048792-Pelagomonas_calceolata.AAC.2